MRYRRPARAVDPTRLTRPIASSLTASSRKWLTSRPRNTSTAEPRVCDTMSASNRGLVRLGAADWHVSGAVGPFARVRAGLHPTSTPNHSQAAGSPAQP